MKLKKITLPIMISPPGATSGQQRNYFEADAGYEITLNEQTQVVAIRDPKSKQVKIISFNGCAAEPMPEQPPQPAQNGGKR